jgi:hypothetical protein
MKIAVNLDSSVLPWDKRTVFKVNNFVHGIDMAMPLTLRCYLPKEIHYYAEADVARDMITQFIDETSAYLVKEITRREWRKDQFVRYGGLNLDEIERFMTERTNVQPWVIFHSNKGGLEDFKSDSRSGIIPCSTMRNHGIAWRQTQCGTQTWIVTSHKEHATWDMDSDIGHESAHAGFAHLPLYTQLTATDLERSSLPGTTTLRTLTSAQAARAVYYMSELIVVAVRGERRSTPTGLPIASFEELLSFIRICSELAPWWNSNGILRSAEMNQPIDVESDPEVFQLAGLLIRIFPALVRDIGSNRPPDLSRHVES